MQPMQWVDTRLTNLWGRSGELSVYKEMASHRRMQEICKICVELSEPASSPCFLVVTILSIFHFANMNSVIYRVSSSSILPFVHVLVYSSLAEGYSARREILQPIDLKEENLWVGRRSGSDGVRI